MPSVALTLPEALKRAIAAYNQSKFSEVEQLCYAMIAAKHDFFEALHLLAAVQAKLGRSSDALSNCRQALAIRPDNALALYNCGGVLESVMRFDDALASYENAIALKPDFADALHGRGKGRRGRPRIGLAWSSHTMR